VPDCCAPCGCLRGTARAPAAPAAFKDGLIPHAVEWFTGEIAPPMFDDFGDEFEEGEDDAPAPARR
jgi:hypothetical protein